MTGLVSAARAARVAGRPGLAGLLLGAAADGMLAECGVAGLDPALWLEGAAAALEGADPARAARLLARAEPALAGADPATRAACALLLARARDALGQPQAALAACWVGLAANPVHRELAAEAARLLRAAGREDLARQVWRDAGGEAPGAEAAADATGP